MLVKIDDVIVTKKFGSGILVDIEAWNNRDGQFVRFGLILVNNPFSYPVAYFTPDELLTDVSTEEACNEN